MNNGHEFQSMNLMLISQFNNIVKTTRLLLLFFLFFLLNISWNQTTQQAKINNHLVFLPQAKGETRIRFLVI